MKKKYSQHDILVRYQSICYQRATRLAEMGDLIRSKRWYLKTSFLVMLCWHDTRKSYHFPSTLGVRVQIALKEALS